MNTTLSTEEIKSLISGTLSDPFSFLGAHPLLYNNREAVAVRALLPGAKSVRVMDLDPEREVVASIVDRQGLFEAILPGGIEISPYRLKVSFDGDTLSTFYDCYSFLPVLSDYDLYLFNQGNKKV